MQLREGALHSGSPTHLPPLVPPPRQAGRCAGCKARSERRQGSRVSTGGGGGGRRRCTGADSGLRSRYSPCVRPKSCRGAPVVYRWCVCEEPLPRAVAANLPILPNLHI